MNNNSKTTKTLVSTAPPHQISTGERTLRGSAFASHFVAQHINSMTASPDTEDTISAQSMEVAVPGVAYFSQADSAISSATDEKFMLLKDLKTQWLKPTLEDSHNLLEMLQTRMAAGHGETMLELGVDAESGTTLGFSAEEFDIALATLTKIATSIHAVATLIHQKKAVGSSNSNRHRSGYVLVRHNVEGNIEEIVEIRVACCGNVDAGKSTLLGVLTSGTLDDGRGHARVSLFTHQHEIDSGRTSSVGQDIMGFDPCGKQIIKAVHGGRNHGWEEISAHASKVITFLDLAGHEKYLKTTVFGMTGCAPDYVMLIIGANAGIIGMTKEHLGLALALNVPVLVVITKIDMCPPNILEATIRQLTKILKSSGCRKMPMFVKDIPDVVTTAQNFVSERVCPIFQLSNVTGDGVDLLKTFLNLLPVYKNYNNNEQVEFQITDTFSVPGVGTVVSGTCMSGAIHLNDQLLIGPDSLGQFTPCSIKGIHRKRSKVSNSFAGQNVSLALKKVRRSGIRKGMVIVSMSSNPRASWEFEAEILVLYHSSTIAIRYQAMVHCGSVRQAARVCEIVDTIGAGGKCVIVPETDENAAAGKRVVRTGDRATIRFRFLQSPEYIKEGVRLLFREGRTKGVGKITRVLYDA